MTKYKELETLHRFVFRVNNYCNLHCEYCSTLSHIPFSPISDYPDRKEKWEMPLDTVERFCEVFRGIGEKTTYVRLLGGEVTALPIEKVEEIIDILYNNNRKMWLLTNGFNLLGISKKHINKIQYITLDDHGINHKHVSTCLNYLKGFYTGKAYRMVVKTHYNLETAIKHPSNQGLACKPLKNFVVDLTFYRSAIYPCCNGPGIEAYNKTTILNEALIDAGWTLHNSDVLNTLNNWRKTLPTTFMEMCLNHCWKPHWRIDAKTAITLKSNDVIVHAKTLKILKGDR